MARRPISDKRREELASSAAAAAMAAWAGSPKKRGRSSWNEAAAREAVREMIAAQDWARARPQHFVELYAHLHERVYGTPPLELGQKTQRLAAASMAARALKQHFGGDPDAFADFMRWAWQRQAHEEKKRRAGLKDNDFRLTWRYQFSARLVTDYRRASVADGGRR